MPNPLTESVTSFLAMDILERAGALERQGNRVAHLELGEPGFDTPEPIKEAAIKAIRDGQTHYTHSQGMPALREAICEHYRIQYGVDVHPDRIIVTSGTSPAMLLTFHALLHAGDTVLLTDPHYACYPNFALLAGGRVQRVATPEEDGFQFTPRTLTPELAARARAVMLNSPANPSGTVIPGEHLEAFARLDTVLVSDEIYHGLVYEGRARSVLEYTDQAFVLNGFSKLWAMTGWRLGWVVVPERYLPAMRRMQQNLFICAGSVAQHAGLAALTECRAEVAAMVAEYAKRRKRLIAGLKKLGLGVAVEPTGAFYVMANVKHLGQDSLSLAHDILEKALVGVTPGVDFGPGGEGYLRFSYAGDMESIELGLERLGGYLGGR